jgi:hypothetical protein
MGFGNAPRRTDFVEKYNPRLRSGVSNGCLGCRDDGQLHSKENLSQRSTQPWREAEQAHEASPMAKAGQHRKLVVADSEVYLPGIEDGEGMSKLRIFDGGDDVWCIY